jgi:hypothetical protein
VARVCLVRHARGPHALTIRAFPFDKKWLREEGEFKISAVEGTDGFREWVRNYGGDFRYDQGPGRYGDTFIFAWAEEFPWLAVADAVVVCRYRRELKGLRYHVITRSLRVFPNPVRLRKAKPGARILSPIGVTEYGRIIEKAYG